MMKTIAKNVLFIIFELGSHVKIQRFVYRNKAASNSFSNNWHFYDLALSAVLNSEKISEMLSSVKRYIPPR